MNINKIIQEDIDYIISNDLPWYKLKDKTILISGANGLLPSYLVYTLMNLNDKMGINCKIIGVVRNREKTTKKFKDNINRDDFKILISDICNLTKVNEKVDYIIHAASQASPIYYKTDPIGTINANVLGTNNLLNIAFKHKVKGFLFVSSGEVYGDVQTENNFITEEDYGYLNPNDIRSCYAESKRLGETMCLAWHTQHGVPCKIARVFHTYGPGVDFNDGRVFADFIANAVNGDDILIKSDGSAKRSFCYVADTILGFFTILLKGKDAESYNIGNDKCDITIKELANIICNLVPDKNIKVVIDKSKQDLNYIKSDIKSSKPSIVKAEQLGWKPIFGIEKGFYRTIASYK